MTNEELHRLVDGIYGTSYDDRLWQDIMPVIKTHLHVSHATVGFFDAITSTQDSVYADCSPYYAELFHHLGDGNPFVGAMNAAPLGSPLVDQLIMETTAFERTSLFNDWLRPQDDHSGLVVKMVSNGTTGGYLGLTRGGRVPKFDSVDLALLQRLAPALVRVAALRGRIGHLNLERESRGYDKVRVGFIVADAKARILATNELGGQLLDEGAALRRDGDLLCTVWPADTEGLRSAIAAAAGTAEIMPVPSQFTLYDVGSDLPQFAVTIHPMPDAGNYGLPVGRGSVLFVQRLVSQVREGFEASIQRVFGLTPREAALATALASGKSVRDFAESAFVSMPTARTHLSQVFRKTGTSQQSQLVSLLLSILPIER